MMIAEKKPGIWARKWVEEGREEGNSKGRVEGKAELLLQLIEQRFGPVPEAIELRVHAASTEQLNAWSLNLLGARTLEDVIYG